MPVGNGKPGLYYFEVGFKDFYTQEMNKYDDWTDGGGTVFSNQRKDFC
jgi:hypothetical protein